MIAISDLPYYLAILRTNLNTTQLASHKPSVEKSYRRVKGVAMKVRSK